jgi:hypothetical protein
MTPQQLFKAACNEAMSKLRDEPVTKVLNRLPIEELLEMQHALAQHFHALYMQVRDTVDAQRPGPSIGEQGRRLSSMRIIDVVPLHRALPGKVEDK